jgi:alpha-beta hydrolase superfamily lysophospholipase
MARAAATPLLVSGVTFAMLELGRRVFRNLKLFVPDRAPLRSWNPEDYGIRRDRVTEEWFETPDGEMLHGWYCRAEKPIASGVFCHGNTGNLTTSADVIPYLLESGFNVLTFDYRGFGKSTGRPTLTGVVADGVTAARYHDEIRPPELPTLLYGYSLGGAVAAQVIRHHPFDGLILQSTFTNLPDVTRAVWPRLPLHRFAGSFFDTRAAVTKLKVPLLILHGAADEVVPSWMAHALHEACPSIKRIHLIDGGLHKDLYIRDPQSLVSTIARFVAELPQQRALFPLEKPGAVDQVIDAALRAVRRQLRARVRHAV